MSLPVVECLLDLVALSFSLVYTLGVAAPASSYGGIPVGAALQVVLLYVCLDKADIHACAPYSRTV
ncbi:hypothetical protein BDV32DRAFT_134002 [Aspergillus pseudonomiae]|nr:hypothetical protein BDV32DRAFT_134002 [Aspergillus pseudonomiae]